MSTIHPTWMRPYELEGLILSGIEGGIYNARDTRDGKRVAVKLIEMKTPGIRNRCFEEADLIRSCRHPNIVQFYIHAVNTASNQSALIMELCSFDYLHVINERGVGTAEQVLFEEFIQIVRAVEYLHDLNVAHMDIKPENILVTVESTETGNRNVLKLTDFSFGIRFANIRQSVPQMGTPGFVAPEMYAPFPYISAKPVDIYAMGVTLYIMTQCNVPYAQYEDDAVTPEFPKIISDTMYGLVTDMMQLDPNSRPAIMELRMRIEA